MTKLTPKQEKFCQEIVKGKSQADAYRAAYNANRMKDETIHSRAYELMKDSEITARIKEIQAPVIAKVRVTREQWLDKMEAFFLSDVRKMFDEFGNPIEIPQLGDDEAMMVEGFEFCEDFTKVKKSNGDVEAVPTGYTKKYKLTPKLKAMLEFGKVMGWYDDQDQDAGPKRVFIRKYVTVEVDHVHHVAGGNAGIGNGHGAGANGSGTPATVVGGTGAELATSPRHSTAPAGAVPSTGSGVLGAVEGRLQSDAGGADESTLSDASESDRPVSRRVVRRQILPGLHDAQRDGADDL